MDEARRVVARLMAEIVDIDPHGRVVPQDDAARSALADRAGRFVLLPSAPDLLVARRAPAAGGAAPRPRCIAAGDVAALPIADLLGFVHQSHLSGVLTVSAGGVDRAITFHDGEVRGARSDASGEGLGAIAVRLGYATPEDVARASASGEPVGKALVAAGRTSPADVWKCLREHVATVFQAVLSAREGVFTLVEEPGAELGTPLALSTQALLLDGMRRMDELALFRARIPGPDTYLRRREPRVPISLKPVEQDLLQLVDGRRRVSDVAQAAHLNEFDATKILYHLAEAGYVEGAAEPAPRAGASLAERVQAIATAMNQILELVTAEVAAAGGAEAFAAGVRTFLADEGSPYAPLWRSLVPGREGALDAAALAARLAAIDREALSRVEPTGDPVRYLLGALRELMFFYLFQAGDRIPGPVDERLHGDVKRRLAALGEPG